MASRRRTTTTFPDVVTERDTESEEGSSSEEEEEPEQEEGVKELKEESVSGEDENNKEGTFDDDKKKQKAPITSLNKVCKVCKRPGHEAGYKGATYIDCPMKPCFLCKMPGHTTRICPHRGATEHGVVPAPRKNTTNPLEYVFSRQINPRIPRIRPTYVIPDAAYNGVIKYHSRRVTCLEFHPTNNHLLLSGDLKGQLGIWNFDTFDEKMIYENIHSNILNNIRFNPNNDGSMYSASSDGTISYTDLQTGEFSYLMNLNPNGWQGPRGWRMFYGMDVNAERSIVLVADSVGFLYLVDTRSNNNTTAAVLIHKKGSKVVGLHCNPLQPDLLLSCGNDHFARLWDIRKLQPQQSLYDLPHKRVVNSAYFSPSSGSKILTTAQDNRLRVWDSIFGNLDSPNREIVHSHDLNRYLTPFRAEWDPKDLSESLAVIGRYISENYNGIALHPIDFIDTSTGQLVAEVMDHCSTTISPINKLHPRDDILATGSSRDIFIWRPKARDESPEEEEEKKVVLCAQGKNRNLGEKYGDDSDSDDDDGCSAKAKTA